MDIQIIDYWLVLYEHNNPQFNGFPDVPGEIHDRKAWIWHDSSGVVGGFAILVLLKSFKGHTDTCSREQKCNRFHVPFWSP